MAKDLESTSFRLPPALKTQLEKEAKRRGGISLSSLMKEILENYALPEPDLTDSQKLDLILKELKQINRLLKSHK